MRRPSVPTHWPPWRTLGHAPAWHDRPEVKKRCLAPPTSPAQAVVIHPVPQSTDLFPRLHPCIPAVCRQQRSLHDSFKTGSRSVAPKPSEDVPSHKILIPTTALDIYGTRSLLLSPPSLPRPLLAMCCLAL